MTQVQNSLAFMIIAGSIDCFGFLGNTVILCYLFFNRVGSKLTTTLMKNQLAFDGLISGFALCSLVIDTSLFDKLGPLSVVFCRLWVSRSIFWFMVLLSEINLVCIAMDRIRAVAFSSTYRQQERTTLIFYYVTIFVYSMIFATPSMFTVIYDGSTCTHRLITLSDNTMDTYMFAYAYTWLFSGYLVPGLVMAGCYITIVVLMHKTILKNLRVSRQTPISETQRNSGSLKMDRSKLSIFSRSFIVTAIVMWSVFLITHAYYTIYAILCTHEIVPFEADSITRRVGIFTTVLNSTFNPLIMIISSPPFRRGIWRFLQSYNYATTTFGGNHVTRFDGTSRNHTYVTNRNHSSSTVDRNSRE
ncbi:Amine GPCR [Fasciola hepatica]|uniref:Amine GPCR n=1 Tax=Fasciola hepatica TaxID=6192 RepID=A0A2H1C0W7_FASHE|nr:Amine GPCR [Fasciola hepatica]